VENLFLEENNIGFQSNRNIIIIIIHLMGVEEYYLLHTLLGTNEVPRRLFCFPFSKTGVNCDSMMFFIYFFILFFLLEHVLPVVPSGLGSHE